MAVLGPPSGRIFSFFCLAICAVFHAKSNGGSNFDQDNFDQDNFDQRNFDQGNSDQDNFDQDNFDHGNFDHGNFDHGTIKRRILNWLFFKCK